MTTLHAGGKFDGRASSGYKTAGGLHGVGASIVNALSEWTHVQVRQNGKVHQQKYERGYTRDKGLKLSARVKGQVTTTTFMPDSEIFETIHFSHDVLAERLREFAFLNRGIKIVFKDERLTEDGKEERNPCVSVRGVAFHRLSNIITRTKRFSTGIPST